MIFCSVTGCYSNNKFGTKRTFYKFPMKFLDRACKWHQFCQDPNLKISENRHICDLHFVDTDFESADRLKLNPDAVPTLNGPPATSSSLLSTQTKLQGSKSRSKKAKPLLPQEEMQAVDSSLIEYDGIVYSKDDPSTNLLIDPKCTASSDIFCEDPYDKIYSACNVNDIHTTLEESTAIENNSIKRPEEKKQYQSLKQKSISKTSNIIQIKNFEVEAPNLDSAHDNNVDSDCNDHKVCNETTKMFEKISSNDSKVVGIQLSPKTSFRNCDLSHAVETIRFPGSSTIQDSNKKSLQSCKITESFCTDIRNKYFECLEPMKTIKYLYSDPQKCKSVMIRKLQRKNSLKKYIRPIKRNLCPSLNIDDPKYSIAAIAESLGTFNSIVKEPLDPVDLDKGQWYKLYTPIKLEIQKMPSWQINPIVNQLRAKLHTLHERDQLEVSFLLSLLSAYPGAPVHIKDLLLERLNVLYIATTFNWETALALAKKEHHPPNLKHSFVSATSDVYRSKNLWDHDKIPIKRPKFAFEIIVQEKGSNAKDRRSPTSMDGL